MRKFSLIIIITFFSLPVFAQRAQEVGLVSKFGLAGGVTPGWMFVNLDPLNEVTKNLGIEEFPSSGLFTIGGGGYAYLMFIDNVRIGGMGYSGSVSRSGKSGGFNREVEYSIGGGAVSVEYTIPSIDRIAVSVGALIGGGSIEVDIYQNNGSYDWTGLWGEFESNDASQNITRNLKHSYFSIAPTVNVDIPLVRFFAIRVGGGYQFTFGDTWTVDNDVELTNVPSDLNGNSFFIQTGVLFGFFAF